MTCLYPLTYSVAQAKNIVNYLEVIHRILKPEGIWINLGPLLWHWEYSQEDISIELSLDEVKTLIDKVGFEIGVTFLRLLCPEHII